MPFVLPPRYPTINQSPTVKAVFWNFDAGDWLWCGVNTIGGASLGFLAGKPLRRTGAYYMGAMGLMLALMGRYRISEYKLLGYYPNPVECARSGLEFKVLRPPHQLEP